MKHVATGFVTALFLLPVLSGNAQAHALAQRYDLPLPLGYFLSGCGAAVAVTFVIFAVFFRKHRDLAKASDRVILTAPIPSVLVASLQVLSIAKVTLLVLAGLFGNPSTFKNITPVSVWVIWWVGFGFLAAFVGNLWPLINPWTVVFDSAETVTRRWLSGLSFHIYYPPWLGVWWPSCVLFLLFAWLELVAPARDVPRNIAIGILRLFFPYMDGVQRLWTRHLAQARRGIFPSLWAVRTFRTTEFYSRRPILRQRSSMGRRLGHAHTAHRINDRVHFANAKHGDR